MRDQLAGRLLAALLDWPDAEAESAWMADLRTLAWYKYDDYEGFVTGGRFFESLARWLRQFPSSSDRMRLLEFIRRELVFVSRAELDHLISLAFPDHIKPLLVETAAQKLELPSYRVSQVVSSQVYQELVRKTLIMGLSDGAKVDRLRRTSPSLSHEQIWPSTDLSSDARKEKIAKLANAVSARGSEGAAQFENVVLVDDFYGSGTSLIRREDGEWKGKLPKFKNRLLQWQRKDGGATPLLVHNAHVTVLLYMASEQAARHITEQLEGFEPEWSLLVIQRLPESLTVTDVDLVSICGWFWDPILEDEHKGRTPLGYGDVALPLVLHHNTPNNSISVLWADSVNRDGGMQRRALFPRYERHHVDRP